MHPAFIHWWKTARAGNDCGPYTRYAGCGPAGARESRAASGSEGPAAPAKRCGSGGGGGGSDGGYEGGGSDGGGFDGGGGSFGVRRPLRFLAYKLQLNEAQIAELARILNDLKTERAQAAVDDRRTVTAFADAIGNDNFDDARANEGAVLRLKSAERLRDAVVTALSQIHKILNPEQRARLAYLIRTGTLSL